MTAVIHTLRERTQARHAALERTPLACDLMSAQLTLPRYVEILASWTCAWAALEDCIRASPFAPQVTALLPSKRAHLGLQDLQFWHEQGHPAVCVDATVNDSVRQLHPTTKEGLLGVCYVARGASLGGQVIARHLIKTLPMGSERGITFFAPGDVPLLTWPEWSHALGEELKTSEAVAQAVGWANVTFAALHRVFSGALVSPHQAQALPA